MLSTCSRRRQSFRGRRCLRLRVFVDMCADVTLQGVSIPILRGFEPGSFREIARKWTVGPSIVAKRGLITRSGTSICKIGLARRDEARHGAHVPVFLGFELRVLLSQSGRLEHVTTLMEVVSNFVPTTTSTRANQLEKCGRIRPERL